MTTMPLAGEFVDQYTSIWLLAKCAEKQGLMVYVKEHGHLPFRDRHFYEQIMKIENVRLIKTTEGTYDIMTNCVAVATQTGTCILEGVLMGKPALVFGNGYSWKGMPGVYKISDEQTGDVVLQEILADNYEIDQGLVKKYFCAIQRGCLKFYGKDKPSEEEKKNDVDCVVELLMGFGQSLG